MRIGNINGDVTVDGECTVGAAEVLDAIGIEDVVAHFGHAEILDEIGETAAMEHFGWEGNDDDPDDDPDGGEPIPKPEAA